MKIDKVGQGRPLVYLHDWGFTSQAWNHQVDFFRARHCNILVDYNADRLHPGASHETLLDDLSTELHEALLSQPPAVLMAHGFGSFLAFELIERGLPVEALVLFGGLVRFTNDNDYLSGIARERVAGMRKALHENPRKMLLGFYQFVFSGQDETPPAELTRAMPVNSLDFLKMSFDAMISHDYRDMLGAFGCRALVVQGEDDKVTPLWQGELIRKLMRNASLELCKSTGHAPFITRYASVNRRVAQFLEVREASASAS
ncbi:MAG: alpha/beta hydrolase [Candidatus Lambdaproteobacteria bacterium]|nr:alpha/beta hydrolase [Candidatus Lambdaproteobacteria bacterium]